MYGPGIDQLLAQESPVLDGQSWIPIDIDAPWRVLWPLVDNLGTVRDLVGTDGSLQQHFRYDAFGKLLEGNAFLTRYLYTAREFDAATGLRQPRPV